MESSTFRLREEEGDNYEIDKIQADEHKVELPLDLRHR